MSQKNPNPLPVSQCPTCGYKMDAASLYTGSVKPRPGDFSCCLKCGELMIYTVEMILRVPELVDLMGLDQATMDEITKVQTAIRKHRVLEKN
jgi:hypothetical protein